MGAGVKGEERGKEKSMAQRGGAKPLVICVGDIHGYFSKLQNLWKNLALRLGPEAFSSATVIFLGDYCDRGPDTALVLDFLVSLPSRHPGQRHVFLCGNHDFAFAAFLGVTPPPPPGFRLASTWDEFQLSEEREGWWSGPGHEDMHVQGRRWAGTVRSKFNSKRKMDYMGSIYDAAPTFESYGFALGDPGLREKVPLDHKKFLQNLVWVHEEEGIDVEKDSGPAFSRLIAIHAGLEKSKPVDAQLKTLHKRDVTIPKIEALSGRSNVLATPPELAKEGVLLVSGHHGTLHVEDHRLVIDEGGGYEDRPIAAIVLPSRIIIRDTDKL